MSIEIGDGGLGYIYLGDVLIAGGGSGPTPWTPGANTVLYMPFKDDLLDHSSNNISFTNTNVTLSNNTAYFNGSASLINSSFTSYLNSAPFTFLVWVKTTTNNDGGCIISAHKGGGSTWNGWNTGVINSSGYKYRLEVLPGGSIMNSGYSTNTWYLLAGVINSSSETFYINGSQVGTGSYSIGTFQNEFAIGQNRGENNPSYWRYWYGYMSELILENKAWTAQDVSKYYNQTKSNYGL